MLFIPVKILAIFLELMERYQPKGLKVHDLEIISIGLAAGIHQIATFNEKDFKAVKEISLLEFLRSVFLNSQPPILANSPFIS